ncbi:MAG TPA: hypothetical protein VFD90_10790 [Gaiellales bacterium]|nr:hypothetical protein [Gaiellales bacterium]
MAAPACSVVYGGSLKRHAHLLDDGVREQRAAGQIHEADAVHARIQQCAVDVDHALQIEVVRRDLGLGALALRDVVPGGVQEPRLE